MGGWILCRSLFLRHACTLDSFYSWESRKKLLSTATIAHVTIATITNDYHFPSSPPSPSLSHHHHHHHHCTITITIHHHYYHHLHLSSATVARTITFVAIHHHHHHHHHRHHITITSPPYPEVNGPYLFWVSDVEGGRVGSEHTPTPIVRALARAIFYKGR